MSGLLVSRQLRLLFAIAVVSLITACGGKPDEPGVLIEGERIPVVDLHMHTGNWEGTPPGFRERLSERVPTGFKWSMGPVTNYLLKGSSILTQLDNAGISAGGVFALWSPPTTGIATNAFTAEQVKVAPDRLFAFASLRVDHWNQDGPEQLKKFESDIQTYDMKGIKIAHGHQQFRFDDERFYGIYEVAARQGAPMYLHTGTSPNPGTRTEPPYCDPAYLEQAIKRYPGAVFILGHSGYDSYNKALTFTDSAIDLAKRYPNVYMEPGALGAERAELVLPDYLQRIKEAGVLDKVIYGSDGVQFPGYLKSHLEAFTTGMKEAGYTKDEMEMVLSGNFIRVFNIPPIEL